MYFVCEVWNPLVGIFRCAEKCAFLNHFDLYFALNVVILVQQEKLNVSRKP